MKNGKDSIIQKGSKMKKFLLSILEAIESIKRHRRNPGIRGR
jgi:hypothetical protein